MNTANLQLEGLYSAVAALMNALREKGILSTEEIENALAEAEAVNTDHQRRDLSDANRDAVRFPFRYLRTANAASARGQNKSFFDIATEIGMTKDAGETSGS